jgi:gluconate 2-dehydrogenase gamma chain
MADDRALTPAELAFLKAAVDTIIPADGLSPSGSACGVVDFIERQVAGAWGDGARFYRDGPFLSGKPEHGYQLRFTPRELFKAGIEAANAWTRNAHGNDFHCLAEAERVAALQAFEQGAAEFAGLPSKEFFEALLAITMEGFFADPCYGGNRDLAAWRMIGYPGLPADYPDAVTSAFGKRYDQPPKSIADFSDARDPWPRG